MNRRSDNFAFEKKVNYKADHVMINFTKKLQWQVWVQVRNIIKRYVTVPISSKTVI